MLFNSLPFIIFFPVVTLMYFVLPEKLKNIWLLLASYFFYMSWNPKYILLLLASTAITYSGALLIEKFSKHKKLFLVLTLVLNFGILFYFKYANFILENFCSVLRLVGITVQERKLDILLPVGISFFTFQAVGYTIDVYRGDTYAEKNFGKYALFVSFFPQLVAGPIERSKNLLKQLSHTNKFDFERMKDGLLLMAWGYFLKMVIADRAAIFVDNVFSQALWAGNGGFYVVVATFLFAFQIYCDFAGYSTIAMGAAKILGYNLMDNFNCPYYSLSVADFWRRWHISLSSWLRDYIYIPLGGSRKGKRRTELNIMITFLASGLWHGATWSFVAWGGLNGLYQVIGNWTKPLREKAKTLLRINSDSRLHQIIQMLITFVLIDFAWLFFRAGGLKTSLILIKSLVTDWNPWILFDGSLYKLGLDSKNFTVLILGIVTLMIVDWQKRKGIVVRQVLLRQHFAFRCVAYVFIICVIMLFGIWGGSYNAASFIYFQF